MILAQRPLPIALPHTHGQALYTAARTRDMEQRAQAQRPAHALMQRAGWAVARLALAVCPHGQVFWIACGPGNNGGDGLQAAWHLHQWGKTVHVTSVAEPDQWPADAAQAWRQLQDAGVYLSPHAPAHWDGAVDALLGLGGQRPVEGRMAEWLVQMAHASAPVVHVDVPSGLDADTGLWRGPPMDGPAPRHTLALLTLKPGLFTGDGRDVCGALWFDDLGVPPDLPPDAVLAAPMGAAARAHNSHKGHYGDVAAVGGASGMTGAVLLAAMAALRSGAGRVMVCPLDEAALPAMAAQHPSLMVRPWATLPVRELHAVCGCGGGDAVRAALPALLSTARSLVLDADALNALQDPSLMQLLRQRTRRGLPTVLTPHPLEAARLLACSAQDVQSDRLRAARELVAHTGAVVVLKGSGTVIADRSHTPVINTTGNALLASGGTGDVLAGMVAGLLAQGMTAFDAAVTAVQRHGLAANLWPQALAFDAWTLTQRLGQVLSRDGASC